VNPGLVRARLVLQEAQALGLDIVDLIAAADQVPDVPTVAAFLASIEPTFTRATASTYRPFWRLAVDVHGDRRLADLGITELQAVVDAAVARARRNRPGSTGRASTETCIAALRALFRRAAASGLVTANPAASLTKPRRARPRRRALDVLEQTELIDAVRATSPDPGLHLLLVRFHLETGARRSGALALRRVDLDERRSTVWLVEKGGSREQPVSPSLLAALQRHGTDLADGVFHRRDGQAITARDYDLLFARARAALAWADRTPVSAHVLRHTAITAIGRIGGYPVAQAFAGHNPPTVTGRYLHATLAEVASAVAVMTGESHPLASPPTSAQGFGRDAVDRDRRGSLHAVRLELALVVPVVVRASGSLLVDDGVMAAVQHLLRCESPETRRGTGNEDDRHAQARFLVKNSSRMSNGMRWVLS
jgi:integrase/recombinase XerC